MCAEPKSKELLFIRDDLGLMERYVHAHELGHAILHPDQRLLFSSEE